MHNEPPCIRIIDDEPAVRKLLAALAGSIGFSVRTYESAEQFMATDRLSDPGCVLVDLGLKGISGKELVGWISRQPVSLPTIVVSGQGSIQLAVECLKNGASDFLEKPFDSARLLTVVRDVVAADADNRVASELKENIRSRYSKLSLREQQVLSCLADGMSNKQIAGQLGLSSKTVEHHRAHMMQKMQTNSLAEVVKAFVSLGLPETSGDPTL